MMICNPLSGNDWKTDNNSNGNMLCGELPYTDDFLLRQVLTRYRVEPLMSEGLIAQIEEETPEMLAQYDPATYEYVR